jgi:drug/metabolite transporter (DMT)-like permease
LTALPITLCIICQLLMVAGQLMLKHAMTATEATSVSVARIRNFAMAIGCMTLWFFLWLGLMRHWDLSKLYPFEGLNPAVLALGAWLILKEKLPARAWIGLLVVCAGIALVARS